MSKWNNNPISTKYSSSYYDNGLCDYFDDLLELNIVEKNLGKVENSNVLDLASGNGRFTQYFSSKNCSVNAVDLEQKHVDFLNERFKDSSNVKVTHMDALQYVLETKCKYDIVVISGLLLFFNDKIALKMLDNIFKVLSDKGVVVIRDFVSKKSKITIESSVFDETILHYRPIKFYKDRYHVFKAVVCRPNHPFIKYEKKLPYVFLQLIYKLIYSNYYFIKKSWFCRPYKNMLLFLQK